MSAQHVGAAAGAARRSRMLHTIPAAIHARLPVHHPKLEPVLESGVRCDLMAATIGALVILGCDLGPISYFLRRP
jgi:hypothetical protein